MERRIDAHIARTQFGQIMDLATKNNERFVVDRRGEPAVVIMSVQDFIRTVAPPPDWMEKAWTGARRRGLEALSREESRPRSWRTGAPSRLPSPPGLSDPGGDRHQCDRLRPALSIRQRSADPACHSPGLIQPCFSEEILEEYAEVLARPKFAFTGRDRIVLAMFRARGEFVPKAPAPALAIRGMRNFCTARKWRGLNIS